MVSCRRYHALSDQKVEKTVRFAHIMLRDAKYTCFETIFETQEFSLIQLQLPVENFLGVVGAVGPHDRYSKVTLGDWL